jgi:hypothetical protein
LRACPRTVGDWLILRSLRSKMCGSVRQVAHNCVWGFSLVW